jgi:poly(3-hydroxyalkanoate) synthetase
LFTLPVLLAASAGEAIAALNPFFRCQPSAETEAARAGLPRWTTPHQLRLELGTMALRDFSVSREGVPALICAPFALHCATIADFAAGRSVVESLLNGGIGRVHVTDWHSASPEMRFLSIDNYLADLNVAVDELEPPVDLIGLCQGGWLSLAYAGRFPHKVRRLVLVGAPVDIAAGQSLISRWAAQIPLAALQQYVDDCGGRILGKCVLPLWGSALTANNERHILQMPAGDHSTAAEHLLTLFHDWYDLTVNLPGTYYLQVVSWLYKENRLAGGRFVALGRRVNLANVHHPIFLLAARDDELVAVEQLLATEEHVGTPHHDIRIATEPCGHLSLFVGAETMKRSWPQIARWLGSACSGVTPTIGRGRERIKSDNERVHHSTGNVTAPT